MDLTNLFNHLTGFSREVETTSLILSPTGFRPWVLEAIARERESGVNGRICIKVNGLTDPQVIDALYEASQAGCRIELLVRGVCCIRPQIPGLSDNITVKSIVGEYLEHSRIYRFGVPGRDVLAKTVVRKGDPPKTMGNKATYFIGSADLMERNLDHRIEAVVPVRPADLCAQTRRHLGTRPSRRHVFMGARAKRRLASCRNRSAASTRNAGSRSSPASALDVGAAQTERPDRSCASRRSISAAIRST